MEGLVQSVPIPKPSVTHRVTDEGKIIEITEETFDLRTIFYRGVRYNVTEVKDLGNYLKVEVEASG